MHVSSPGQWQRQLGRLALSMLMQALSAWKALGMLMQSRMPLPMALQIGTKWQGAVQSKHGQHNSCRCGKHAGDPLIVPDWAPGLKMD